LAFEKCEPRNVLNGSGLASLLGGLGLQLAGNGSADVGVHTGIADLSSKTAVSANAGLSDGALSAATMLNNSTSLNLLGNSVSANLAAGLGAGANAGSLLSGLGSTVSAIAKTLPLHAGAVDAILETVSGLLDSIGAGASGSGGGGLLASL